MKPLTASPVPSGELLYSRLSLRERIRFRGAKADTKTSPPSIPAPLNCNLLIKVFRSAKGCALRTPLRLPDGLSLRCRREQTGRPPARFRHSLPVSYVSCPPFASPRVSA